MRETGLQLTSSYNKVLQDLSITVLHLPKSLKEEVKAKHTTRQF